MNDIKIDCSFAEMLAISKCKAHPKNNNRHSREQIERLAKIIEYQGFRSPIVISLLSGFIVKGHGRLMAAKKLGMKKVPVDFQSYDDESQEYADLTADNEIARWAELDMDSIMDNAHLLADLDIDMLGLKDLELPDLDIIVSEKNKHHDIVKDNESNGKDDVVPEISKRKKPKTKRGDIWILGKHRVMCGDSTVIDDVEKLMNGEKADMVFTDPPYGINYQSNKRTKSDKFQILKNDDEFLDIVPIIEMFSRGFVFIWSTWKIIGEWLENTKSLGKPSNTIVWFKGGGGIGDIKKTFSTDWELALVWHRGQELKGKRVGSVWSIGKDKGIDYKHPTQKPVQLAEEALDKCSKSGYRILDLFLGSGSTLIACEKKNRKCYGMELDEHYCDVIVKRWEDYTGKKAYLEK